jgi:hypothetical protein
MTRCVDYSYSRTRLEDGQDILKTTIGFAFKEDLGEEGPEFKLPEARAGDLCIAVVCQLQRDDIERAELWAAPLRLLAKHAKDDQNLMVEAFSARRRRHWRGLRLPPYGELADEWSHCVISPKRYEFKCRLLRQPLGLIHSDEDIQHLVLAPIAKAWPDLARAA